MNDDDDFIVRQRIAGRSVRAIAKALSISVADVNRAIDRWAETMVNPALRKQTLALELRGSTKCSCDFTSTLSRATLRPAPWLRS
jgi:hypothetical protein